MQFLIRYLKGEFGLLKTFWLGLILCGALISVISHNLEDYVWFAYNSQDMIVAAVMQWVIIALEILLIAIAVAVILPAFMIARQITKAGWLVSLRRSSLPLRLAPSLKQQQALAMRGRAMVGL